MKKILVLIAFIVSIYSLRAHSQENINSSISLVIDEYSLDTSLFESNKQHKFLIDSVCLDLFDFKVLQGYVDEAEASCIGRIKKRDMICLDNIEKIQKEHKAILNSLRLKYDNLLKDKEKLKIRFDNNVTLHKERISKYKWIIGTSSILFISTVVFIAL
jgi:hypothetical protein